LTIARVSDRRREDFAMLASLKFSGRLAHTSG
jgi:hypothetical protein